MAAARADWLSQPEASTRQQILPEKSSPESFRGWCSFQGKLFIAERRSPTRHDGLAEWGGRIMSVATRHLKDVLAALYQTFIQDFAHLARQSGRQIRFWEE